MQLRAGWREAGLTETLRARVSRDRDFATFTDLAVSDKNANSWFGDSLSELLGALPGYRILATWPEQAGPTV